MRQSLRQNAWRLVLAAAVAAALAGCGPEAGRPRGAGAGSGADVDNKPANFQPKSKVFTSDNS